MPPVIVTSQSHSNVSLACSNVFVPTSPPELSVTFAAVCCLSLTSHANGCPEPQATQGILGRMLYIMQARLLVTVISDYCDHHHTILSLITSLCLLSLH